MRFGLFAARIATPLAILACTDAGTSPNDRPSSSATVSVLAQGTAGQVFGPERFERSAGAPVAVTRTLAPGALTNVDAPFTLHLLNGPPGTSRTSSAIVTVDGIPVVALSDLSQKVATLERVVGLTAGSEIVVELRGAPGSAIELSIQGVAKPETPPPVAAQISIQKVTVAGNPAAPVDLNNVKGQIDVTLNLNPGDQTVTKVEVLVDNIVACSQNVSVAESEQFRLAAAFEEIEAVDIVCSINTAAFNPTTGAVNFANGSHTLTARATIGGTTPGNVESPSQALTFNNQSGFVALVSNTNTVGGPASAINPTTGRKWVQGNVQLKLVAVNYTAGGATVTTLNGAFLGKTFTDTPDAGTQIFTLDFPNATTPANPLNIGGYETAALSETVPLVTGSNLSNGNAGPSGAGAILNIGPKADTLGLARLDSTRVDNKQPATPTVAPFTPWVNAAFAFDTTKMGVSGVTDSGVDNVTVEFWVIKGAVPTASACDLTGMTKVTTSAGLVETTLPEYNTKVVILDALGNRRCAQLANAFGADFGAPMDVTVAFTGTGAATQYTINTSGDTLSGIPGFNPALLSIVRMGTSSANNACVVGTGTFAACAAVAAPSIGSATGGSSTEGYYTITAQLTDVAGNAAPKPPATRTFVVDVTAPTFTGSLVLSQTYAGNAAAQFGGIAVNDNLDLASLFGQVSYGAAGINIEFPSISLGTFGAPLVKSFSGSYTIPSLIRCMVPAGGPFAASNTNKATQITIFGTDEGGNFGTTSPIAGDFTSRITADCGAAGSSAVTAFTQSAPSYGTGKTEVDIDGADVATSSATAVALEAIVTVPENAANPFSRVEFYYLNPATNGYVLIGAATALAGPNTSPTRTHLYKLAWNPDAAVPVGSVTVIAVGVDAEGDAAPTGTQTVTTVQ